jgi:glycerophosphoryl diester phosphodiesterase
MLVLSHRGYHEHLPENTLEAFQAAVDLGVDGIETDLRVTADGQLVLIHDRIARDGRLVSQVTRAELMALVGHDVPLASAALQQWPNLLWNLEIKTPAALGPVLDLIRRFQPTDRLLVTSFWHNLVEKVSRHSDVDCGLLVSHRPSERLAPSNIKTIVWCFEFLDRETVEAAAAAGYRNFCYSIGTREEHVLAREWGLDGIITDWPQRAR